MSGVGGRQPAANAAVRLCAACGTEFQPYRDYQRACSRKCRMTLGAIPEGDRPHEVSFTCRMCGGDSVRHASGYGGKFYYCLECTPLAAKASQDRKNEARRLDPERAQKNRKASLKTNYQLTPEQADAMVAAQGGLCAICGEPPKADGVRAASRLHIDHDHKTGQVRGLLCNHCNRGIGAFRDRRHLLELAINYLDAYEV